MCIICVDLIRQGMSIPEAQRNLGELTAVITKETDSKEYAHQSRLLESLDSMDMAKIDEELQDGIDMHAEKVRLNSSLNYWESSLKAMKVEHFVLEVRRHLASCNRGYMSNITPEDVIVHSAMPEALHRISELKKKVDALQTIVRHMMEVKK
jgi:hypothetical protein